jgi:hypothetical protein
MYNPERATLYKVGQSPEKEAPAGKEIEGRHSIQPYHATIISGAE